MTAGGLSELGSNPANPAGNTVIKSAFMCPHTQHPSLPHQAPVSSTSHGLARAEMVYLTRSGGEQWSCDVGCVCVGGTPS